MKPFPSEPLSSATRLLGELHIKSVRLVHWPCGGRVVGFTVPHRETTRGTVADILRQAFGDDALLRRFCPHRLAGEFALFATAAPPLVGEILRNEQ